MSEDRMFFGDEELNCAYWKVEKICKPATPASASRWYHVRPIRYDMDANRDCLRNAITATFPGV